MLHGLIERASFRGLVFSQSWEDPVLDREALQVAPDRDTVLSITSGGCSSLNLLCLQPRKLISIDLNPVQSHLMELKLEAIRRLEHDDFYALVASPDGAGAVSSYRRALRAGLSEEARAYWDSNTRLLERGLIAQGKLALFLRGVARYVRWRIGEERIQAFFEVDDLDEQRAFYYSELHPRLWPAPVFSLAGLLPVQSCAGMHPNQHQLIRGSSGMRNYVETYLRDRVDYILTNIPIRENYFLAMAATGRFLDPDNVPPYVHERNFSTLKQMADRVTVVTGNLRDFLVAQPEASIDKFNLMDVLDWMDRDSVRDTVRSVVRAGSEGGRFIYRSAIPSRPVPPELAGTVVSKDALARDLFARDRAGNYGSFYVYEIAKERAATLG